MAETKVENSTTDTGANATEQTEQVVSKNESASEVNQRLLKESQEWKLKAQQEKREREKLVAKIDEEKGEYKKLYESAQSKLDQTVKKMVEKELRSSVREAAAKAGCIDVDLAFMAGDPKMLKFDEETGEVVGAELFIETVKKSKPHLFQNPSAARVNPSAPGGTGTKTMTLNEILKTKGTSRDKLWGDALSSMGKK
jgi:hypothetical protein